MQFRLLGTFEVEDEEGLVALGGPKERAALAVLALRVGEVVSDEALIAAIWGEEPPRTATKTLQTYIFRLRRSLATSGGEPVVTTRGGGYRLTAGVDQVDVARFEHELTAARQASAASDGVRALVHLNRALELWRGEPLGEFSFSEILRSEAARLSELRMAAWEQRFAIDLACGRHHELVPELYRMVSENPLRESLWESLMLALYRSGRQADALRAYQRFRALLGEELGIEPSPSLKEVERRILVHDPEINAVISAAGPRDPGAEVVEQGVDRSVEVAFPAALAASDAITFVGRIPQREQLMAAWRAARNGVRSGVLISGEPGIGKTALAGAFARDAHAEGATVLYGRCDEEAIIPYQPFVEALRQYVVDAPAALLRKQIDTSGVELARLIPELRRRLPELPGFDGSESSAPGERYVLFDAVASLLADAAARRPLVLVLDDLHWADRSTLLLLRHVVRREQAKPLLVVGTYRETELGRRHPLAETLALLHRDKSMQRMALKGLPPDEVALIVRESGAGGASSGGLPARELAERIASETAGNPLFVWEVVRHVRETAGDVLGHDEIFIPEGVREVIGRRMARLSDDANHALGVAAVIGRQFELAILAPASGLNDSQVVSVLEEAVAAGLVREVGKTGEAHEFSHALVRRSLVEELSASRRIRIHRQVSAVLEELEERRPGSRVAELAHHLLEAAQREDVGRAIAYCRKAGDHALAQLAYDEAAGYYRRALDIIEVEEAPNEELRAELLLGLADAISRVDVPRSLGIILDAAEAARRSGSASLLAQAAIAFVGPRVAIQHPGIENDLLEEALAVLPVDDPLVVRLLAAQAQWLSRIARFERLSPLTRRSMGLARRLGDPSLVIAAAVGRLFVLREAADAEERLNLANEILRSADALPPVVRAIALRNQAHALFERGAYAAAWGAIEEHRRVVERIRSPVGLMIAAMLDAMRASIEGRFDEAEDLVATSMDLTIRVFAAATEIANLVPLVPLRWLQGRLPEVEDAIRRASDVLSAAQEPRTGLVAVAAAAGRIEEARSLLAERLPGRYADIPADRSWSVVVFQLAITQPLLNDPERAAELYAVLEPYQEREWMNAGRVYHGCFAHHLGVLAGIAGDLDTAVSHLEHACTRYRALGAPPWLARAEDALAQVLVRRAAPGDFARAKDLAASAAATATRLKMLGIPSPIPNFRG